MATSVTWQFLTLQLFFFFEGWWDPYPNLSCLSINSSLKSGRCKLKTPECLRADQKYLKEVLANFMESNVVKLSLSKKGIKLFLSCTLMLKLISGSKVVFPFS